MRSADEVISTEAQDLEERVAAIKRDKGAYAALHAVGGEMLEQVRCRPVRSKGDGTQKLRSEASSCFTQTFSTLKAACRPPVAWNMRCCALDASVDRHSPKTSFQSACRTNLCTATPVDQEFSSERECKCR